MLIRTVVALVAGVSLALAFEPVSAAYVIPLSVAGFMLSTRGLRIRSGWVPGLAFGVGFYFVHIYWMRAVGIAPWLALAGIEALFYAVLGSASAALHQRRLWPLWCAAAWVTMEVWRSSWPFSGMPWGRLAYGVVDTPAANAMAYVGSTGVSLLLALLGCLLAWVIVAPGRTRLIAAGALVGVGALTALPALVPWTVTSDGSATVAAVQGDVPGDGDDILLDFRQVTSNHVQATIDLAEDVAAGTQPLPDFVVWPENSTAVDPFADSQTNAGIRAASQAIGVPILVGAIVDAGEKHVLNQGIVWDPETGAGERYTKRNPVPYGEFIPFRGLFEGNFGRLALISRDMLAGTRKTPLEIAGIGVADAICFDVAYDDGIYDQVIRGAQLLIVQTSNATFIHTDQIDQQFAITRLRAIETGRWVVVASTNGVSGVISPDGVVVASAGSQTRAVLVERVALSTDITPGVRLGAWTGRLCGLVTVAGLLVGLVTYRRQGHEEVSRGNAHPILTTPPSE